MKPFLTWPGSKTRLIGEISKRYPKNLGWGYNRYVEPFVGGGAVLVDILSSDWYCNVECVINDIEPKLINAYMVIKYNVYDLLDELACLENQFNLGAEGKELEKLRNTMYYEKRDEYNSYKDSEVFQRINHGQFSIRLAALLIFLNHTCFNGLYRLNNKGDFNASLGKYKKPMICDTENLMALHDEFDRVHMTCGDYRYTEQFIDSQTFVYCDPPYRPLEGNSKAKVYGEMFDDTKQAELAGWAWEMRRKGARVVISNSDPHNTNPSDNFFDDLYGGGTWVIDRVFINRNIGRTAESRKRVSELLIKNK